MILADYRIKRQWAYLPCSKPNQYNSTYRKTTAHAPAHAPAHASPMHRLPPLILGHDKGFEPFGNRLPALGKQIMQLTKQSRVLLIDKRGRIAGVAAATGTTLLKSKHKGRRKEEERDGEGRGETGEEQRQQEQSK